jgi:hypothetical protein
MKQIDTTVKSEKGISGIRLVNKLQIAKVLW